MKNYRGGNATEIGNTYTNRSLLGRFFLLPNEIFTLELSAGEIAVYAYLLFCEDRETHLCYPSFRKIGEHTGMGFPLSSEIEKGRPDFFSDRPMKKFYCGEKKKAGVEISFRFRPWPGVFSVM